MLAVLAAASLAAAIPAVPAAAPAAAPANTKTNPAMFVVSDNDTTVYIFGTFHALDGKGEWFNDQVKDAFEQSDELVLETVIPEHAGKPVIVGPAASQPLRVVAPSASFLASTRMAINAGKAQGMQVGNGADMVLRHAADAEGKPVEGLETLESQINMFATMKPTPAKTTATAKDSTLNLSKSMADMQSAWKRGDQSVFVHMLSYLENSSPDTYRVMFTERNGRWADWIRARMQTPGTVFVAVGAGHLAGKDSVLVQLGERGIYSTRVN